MLVKEYSDHISGRVVEDKKILFVLKAIRSSMAGRRMSPKKKFELVIEEQFRWG